VRGLGEIQYASALRHNCTGSFDRYRRPWQLNILPSWLESLDGLSANRFAAEGSAHLYGGQRRETPRQPAQRERCCRVRSALTV
jgi:hypothetical protein